MSLALIGLALVTHRAYAPQVTEPQPVAAVEAAPAPGYALNPYCIDGQPMMHVELAGYPDGTVAFVTVGGAPPYHMQQGETADFAWTGDAYGIYIRTPDGAVQADTTVHWGGC